MLRLESIQTMSDMHKCSGLIPFCLVYQNGMSVSRLFSLSLLLETLKLPVFHDPCGNASAFFLTSGSMLSSMSRDVLSV
jgi:hypothetical protein